MNLRRAKLAAIVLAVSAACAGTDVYGPPPDATPVVIAHRGSSYAAPEHTFAAYDLALADGADYIEQDVQRTRDGVLVVIHDSSLDRTARGAEGSCAGLVSEKTLAQLKTCDAGSWFNSGFPARANPAYAGLSIPTLAEVLDRYGSRTRYYIELKDPEKYPGMEKELVDLLNSRGLIGVSGLPPRVVVQSFDAASLKRMRAFNAGIPLVQLIGRIPGSAIIAALDTIKLHASGIGPHLASVDRQVIEAAHARGLIVHPYTVDDPADMTALLAIGADGVFTNRPALLRTIVSSR